MLFVHSLMTSLLTLCVLSKFMSLIILNTVKIKSNNVDHLTQCQSDYTFSKTIKKTEDMKDKCQDNEEHSQISSELIAKGQDAYVESGI